MKISAGFLGLIFVGLVGWRIGATLTPDAVALTIGMLLGMLAVIPACCFVLASGQQSDHMCRQQQRTALEDIRSQYKLRPHLPEQQYRPPTPNVIFIAPHVRLQNRGEQMQEMFRRAHIYLQLQNMSTDGQGRSVYDFSAQNGTKVSVASRFAETELSQVMDSDFRVARAGSLIQVFEYDRKKTWSI